jgi:hypothetical protein
MAAHGRKNERVTTGLFHRLNAGPENIYHTFDPPTTGGNQDLLIFFNGLKQAGALKLCMHALSGIWGV